MITVNGWKPVIIITKRSILDVAAALDPPLHTAIRNKLANKCLNVRERPGIAESSKVAPTFFCCPVNRQKLGYCHTILEARLCCSVLYSVFQPIFGSCFG